MANDNEAVIEKRVGFNLPTWAWTLIISLLMQVLGAAYVTGTVMQKLSDLGDRMGRLEHRVDSAFDTSGPRR